MGGNMREKKKRARPLSQYCEWCASPASYRSKKHGARMRLRWRDKEIFVHADLCFMKFISAHGDAVLIIRKAS